MTFRITVEEMREAIQSMHLAIPKYGLTAESMPQIVRGVMNGFPDWYKQQLLESQFTDEQRALHSIDSAASTAISPTQPASPR